jgi:hypothetical protein
MDNAELFAKAFERHGLPFVAKDHDPAAIAGVMEQLRLYNALAGAEIFCGVLENPTFNAMATIYRGREFIGIYSGSLITIARFFYAFLSDPSTLLSIGEPSSESVSEEVIAGLRVPERSAPSARRPACDTRFRAAQHLAFCASLLLFFHEFSHLELCHLEFLIKSYGLNEYPELPASDLTLEQSTLRMALEWDADNSGLLSSLNVWRTLNSQIGYPALAPIGPDRSWLVAAEMLFWIMEIVRPSESGSDFPSHPSPPFRLINASLTAHRYGGGVAPLTKNEKSHDSPLKWIIKNALSEKVGRTSFFDQTSIEAQWDIIRPEYARIADDLERLQDTRSEKTGRPVKRLAI